MLVLRWIWWRVTAWGELSTIIASLFLSPLLLFGVDSSYAIDSWSLAEGIKTSHGTVSVLGVFHIATSAPEASTDAWRLLLMTVLSTGIGVAVSLLGPQEEKERLVEFYKRARPPGFWQPIAAAAGFDAEAGVRRLYRGLGAVAVCGLSLFSLLTGFGSWMSDSPPPTWFPNQTAWEIVVIAVGLLTVPVWWKLGFGKQTQLDEAEAASQ
jgi:hypothetical protein